MNILKLSGTMDLGCFSISSLAGDMAPPTKKSWGKEVAEAREEGAVESLIFSVPIYTDLASYVDKLTLMTWAGIYQAFACKEVLEDE